MSAEEKKIIDADVNTFINSLVADSHQEIYYRGWVDLYYEDKKPKSRILVVTNFRVFTIRINMLGKSVRQQFPIRDLLAMTAIKDISERLRLQLEFKDYSEAGIEHGNAADMMQITQAILFSFQSISHGRPPANLPRIDLPPQLLKDFLPPEPDTQDGLLAAYLAECDYVAIPQRIHVLDHLMTCFQLHDTSLDIDECFSFLGKESSEKDLRALAAALKYSTWFDELVAVGNLPIKSEGLSALAPIFGEETRVDKLVLVNIGASKAGFTDLAKQLAKGNHSLTFLNLSKNKLGDDGIKILAEGLEASKKTLHTLSLRNCSLSSKGFKSLQQLVSTARWMEDLKVLDVSGNSAGKSGTEALAVWLKNEAVALEQLHVTSCEVDLETLVKAITQNKKLYERTLRTLNISGNKIPKNAVGLLCSLMINTSSISQLFFAKCDVSKPALTALLEAALSNDNGVQFSLDFSSNDLGAKGAKDLASTIAKWTGKDKRNSTAGVLHTLNLSDNGLGNEGVVTVCKALSGYPIHTLALDANIKIGIFTSGKEAGEELANLVSSTPSLKELSIAGDDAGKYMKTALLPLFKSLKDNKTLVHLDVSRNQIGDAGIKTLAEAIATNEALTSINVDKNKIGMKGIREIHKAVSKNRSLTDWEIPMTDIAKVFKSFKNEKKMTELRVIVAEFETVMDRNEEDSKKRREADEKKTESTRGVASSASGFSAMRSLRVSALGHGVGRPHKRQASRILDTMLLKKAAAGFGLEDEEEAALRPATVTEEDDEHDDEDDRDDDDDDDDDDEDDDDDDDEKEKKEDKQPDTSTDVEPATRATAFGDLGASSTACTPGQEQSASHGTATTSVAPPLAPHPADTARAPPPSSYLDWKTNTFNYECLAGAAATLPAGVDPSVREMYLSDEDFKKRLNVEKDAFLALPKWKQTQLKRSVNLL